MENGYVRIYRTLTQKGYYTRSEYVHLWVHLIMKATYRDKEYLFNGAIQNLEAGQFITGRKILSKETGISQTTIERVLTLFENEHQIGQQKNNKFRIISILNWNEYQTDGQQNGQQTDSKRTSSGHLADTNNKDKKEKNKEYTSNFLSFYTTYPKHKARDDAFKAWNTLRETLPELQIILSAIEEQKKSEDWLKDNGKYIPLPATWLRDGRWADEFKLEKKEAW